MVPTFSPQPQCPKVVQVASSVAQIDPRLAHEHFTSVACNDKIGSKGARLSQNRPQKWILCKFLHHTSGTHFSTTIPMPKSCAGCKLESRKLWRVCTTRRPQRVNTPSLGHTPPHHTSPHSSRTPWAPTPTQIMRACKLSSFAKRMQWQGPLFIKNFNPLGTGAEYSHL